MELIMGQGRLKKYAFINAKLRARISNILSDDVIDQMIKARSLPETIRVLHDTSFQVIEDVYNRTGDLKLAELELYRKEIHLYHELERYVRGDVLDFVKALTKKYEIENLKAALRLWFDRVMRKRNIDDYTGYLYREVIHYDLHVDQIINVETIEGIIDILSGTPYAQIIKENSDQLELTRTLFSIETALDRYFYKQLNEKSKNLEKPDFEITRRMIGVEIDMENISWLIRFRDFYKMTMDQALKNMIPYGHHLDRKALEDAYATGDSADIIKNLISKKYTALSSMLGMQSSDNQGKLVLVNRLLDQIILYEVKRVKGGYPFNIGIVLAYFVLKKNEIRKVMTILNAKYYNIKQERIKSVI